MKLEYDKKTKKLLKVDGQAPLKVFRDDLHCTACHNRTKRKIAVLVDKYGEQIDKQIYGPEYGRVARWFRYDKVRKWLQTWNCNYCGYNVRLEQQESFY